MVLARRLSRALLLQGFWRFRWFHAVMLWVFMGMQAWDASPLVVYAFGQPEPGTAPRYTGTIVVQGTPGRARGRTVAPHYILRTQSGDLRIHCGFRPWPWECWFTGYSGVPPEPDQVYEIGWHWYWGIDYIGYPPRLADLADSYAPQVVRGKRITYLSAHKGAATLFILLLTLYVALAILAFHSASAGASRSPTASTEADPKHP